MDLQGIVVVQPPPSSNRIDMDSEDSDSDLENDYIDDEHENLAEIDEVEHAKINALEARQDF